MDTTVTAWGDKVEKSVGDVDSSRSALWAGIDDFAFDGTHAVVVDVDVLVAVRVEVGVNTVCHVGSIHGNKQVAVGASLTARGKTNGDIVVGHVASMCTSGGGSSRGNRSCSSRSGGDYSWRNVDRRGSWRRSGSWSYWRNIG